MLDPESIRFQATTLTMSQLTEHYHEARANYESSSGAERAYWLVVANIYLQEYHQREIAAQQELRDQMKDYLIIRTDAPNLWYFAPEALPEIIPLAQADLEADNKVWWHDDTIQVYIYEEVLDENGDPIWNEDHTLYLADKFLETEDANGDTSVEYIGQVWRAP